MGPAEAVQAHEDLGAQLSMAAHFQVFQLGPDGFHDAVNELAAALTTRGLKPKVFVAPSPGQAIELRTIGLAGQSPREAPSLEVSAHAITPAVEFPAHGLAR
jgi:hypothetical protein